MSDETHNYRDAPDYRGLRGSAAGRVFVDAHWALREGHAPAYVMPAVGAQIGMMALESDRSVYHPTLTLYALQANIALNFLGTPDEFEETGRTMIRMAEQIRAQAGSDASAAIERARKTGGAV